MNKEVHQDMNELLRRLKYGDREAFAAIYDRHHTGIYLFILRFVKVPGHAEDILQDVFLKIWEVRERLDPERSFQAYVYKIARNRVFRFLKSISENGALHLEVMDSMAQAVDEPNLQLQWKQYQDLLSKAIQQLPPQRQRVFRLCREEGKSYEEAAAELGISRNTIKEHMVAAMKSIRDYLVRYGDLSLVLLFFFSQKK